QNTTQLDTRQLEIMKRLYTSPYRDRKERNPDRVAGTCEWFTQHQLFLDWKKSTFSRLLWVSADPGCGKSVLVKYLVDHILLSETSRTVCYFFFKDDFEDQKSIVSALCCILYQLFQQNPALLSESITNQFEAGGERFLASFSELWHILLSTAQDVRAGEIICVLDAIDECEDHGRSRLAKELCKLYGADSRLTLNLKFLVTSRPFGKIRQGFQPLQIPNLPIIHLSGESEEELKKISAEIDTYIKARVQDIAERLQLGQKERRTLLQELLRVPNRTYLWVYLILDLVESDINIDRTGILRATTHIPRTVDEAYNRILSRSSDFKKSEKILHIVMAAERALTLAELGFALAIQSYHQSYDEIDIQAENRLRENIRDSCGLFVTIINSKVYLLHQTAREFLVRNAESQSTNSITQDLQWKHRLMPQESHNVLAKICVCYLILEHQDNKPLSELSRYDETRILWDYSANYWATHIRASQIEVRKSMMQSILRICDTGPNCDAWLRTFWEKTSTPFPEQLTTLMIVSYFGLYEAVQMIISTMTDNIELRARDLTYGRSALSWAAGNGFDAVVRLLARGHRRWYRKITGLLFGNNVEINSMDESGRTPLVYAIWNRNVAVVKALLKAGAQVNLTDDIGGTPLFYAMSYRREAIVKLLLENGATPISENKMATTLFFSALKKGDVQAVQLFLDSGIHIEAREHDRTPLSVAVEKRNLNMIQLLFKHGANVEPEGNFDAPLSTAVRYKNLEAVRLLLDHAANIETTSKTGDTPLLMAVRNRDRDTIKLLLDRGANIETTSDTGDTPLLMVVRNRDQDTIKLLLDRGANTETTSKIGDTPLLIAVKNRDLTTTKLLLGHGANVEAISNRNHTPLHYAVFNKNMAFIRALLCGGAITGAKDDYDAAQLQIMVMKGGHLDLVQILLDRGTMIIDSRDENGCTPLLLAVERGHSEVVQLLLDRGAPIEAMDTNGRTQLSYATERGY
ncbi:uncharacterized protein TRIVIDRAFT_132672, partial [Trichoderma virens Gv29-8]